jgi:hypothetical protein
MAAAKMANLAEKKEDTKKVGDGGSEERKKDVK